MYRRESQFGRQRSPHHRHHRGDAHRPVHGLAGKIAALSTIVLLVCWAGAATLYILFRDDALKLVAERQASMSRAYDMHVAELETEIERLKSLKLIEQERVDRAIVELARRQTTIENRQSALAGLGVSSEYPRDTGPEVTGSVPLSPPPSSKPSPLSDTILIAPPTDRFVRLESRPLPPLASRADASRQQTASEVRLSNLSRDLARIEAAQSRSLNEAEERYDGRERRMRKVFADLGMTPPSMIARAPVKAAGMGGPFLSWSRAPQDPFTRQVQRVRSAALAVELLEQGLATVPVRRPTPGDADVTSGFGLRLDPFLRQQALHTGIDFRGEPGDPVRATAAGKVVTAERNGGYGLMVEVDHGNGLATRYAHLSAIDVVAGMNVGAGAIIGRVGSTGRSTGPHLHYEVRLNGEATDPQRFLRAGLRVDEL